MELQARFWVLSDASAEQPLFSNGVRLVDPVDRVLAGDDLSEVAGDFNLDPEEVELAVRVFAAAAGRVAKCRRHLASTQPQFQESFPQDGGQE